MLTEVPIRHQVYDSLVLCLCIHVTMSDTQSPFLMLKVKGCPLVNAFIYFVGQADLNVLIVSYTCKYLTQYMHG